MPTGTLVGRNALGCPSNFGSSSSNGCGRPSRKPCSSSQPRSRSQCSCSSVSTPSATMRRSRWWPRPMIEAQIAASSASWPRSCDERAVDLQPVDRQALEVGEARIAGAEIVDRDAHAERGDALHGFDRALGVVHDHALGDLQLQHVGGQREFLDHRGDVAIQLVAELRGRDVDRDPHARPAPWPRAARGGAPLRAARSGRARTISPLSSHTPMNSAGSSRPRSGCCQRASASSASRRPARIEQRLERELELAVAQRLAQARLPAAGAATRRCRIPRDRR